MLTRRFVASRAASAVLASLAIAAASPAYAQEEPNAGDVAAARALGQEGVKLADAGNCTEAVDRLARAEKLFHAPTTLARLGECQVALGKLVEGTESLNRVAREPLPANAPAAFQAAQERAKKILAEAKPRIGKLRITVSAPADAQLTVRLDGELVPLASLDTNRPTDPGEHVIEASAPGHLRAHTKVKLADGGYDAVALTLEPDPNAPRSAAATAAPATSTAPASSRQSSEAAAAGSRAPAYVALGVGIVGLGVGAVTGILALGKKSDLDDACPSSRCAPEHQSTIDSGQTLGTISTVGFGVGIVGVALGTVLLVTSSSSRTTATTPAAHPWIGVGGAGLRGSF